MPSTLDFMIKTLDTILYFDWASTLQRVQAKMIIGTSAEHKGWENTENNPAPGDVIKKLDALKY